MINKPLKVKPTLAKPRNQKWHDTMNLNYEHKRNLIMEERERELEEQRKNMR